MTVQASFDVNTQEGKMRIFNAQNGASVSLKKLNDGDTIEVNAVLLYEDKIDSYGNEQMSTITTLFATDGTSYAGVSETVSKAGEKLIDLMADLDLETVTVKLVKQKSASDREFLNLQVVG